MRRLLLVIPLLIPLCAQAQTTAANPVEPFSYGVRVGTAKNPLIAALSSVVPSAQAGSTQAAMPVEMFSYGRRVGTQSNPIYVNLGHALDGYVTQTALNTALDGYLKADGTTSATYIQFACMTTAQVKALPATDGKIACVNDQGTSSNPYSNLVFRVAGKWVQMPWGSDL